MTDFVFRASRGQRALLTDFANWKFRSFLLFASVPGVESRTLADAPKCRGRRLLRETGHEPSSPRVRSQCCVERVAERDIPDFQSIPNPRSQARSLPRYRAGQIVDWWRQDQFPYQICTINGDFADRPKLPARRCLYFTRSDLKKKRWAAKPTADGPLQSLCPQDCREQRRRKKGEQDDRDDIENDARLNHAPQRNFA